VLGGIGAACGVVALTAAAAVALYLTAQSRRGRRGPGGGQVSGADKASLALLKHKSLGVYGDLKYILDAHGRPIELGRGASGVVRLTVMCRLSKCNCLSLSLGERNTGRGDLQWVQQDCDGLCALMSVPIPSPGRPQS
jgi:hypothetical protein